MISAWLTEGSPELIPETRGKLMITTLAIAQDQSLYTFLYTNSFLARFFTKHLLANNAYVFTKPISAWLTKGSRELIPETRGKLMITTLATAQDQSLSTFLYINSFLARFCTKHLLANNAYVFTKPISHS